MKNVLYVSANGFIGGAEKYLLNIAIVHKELNDNVHFLLFNKGELASELEEIGVKVTVLSNKFRVSSFYQFFKAIFEIRIFLKNNNFSTIHSTMAYSHFVLGLASIGMNYKKVWFQHGPIGGLFDWLASLFSVDILLFSSNYLKQMHYSKFFLRKATYGSKVIPLPVNVKNSKLTDAFALRKTLNVEGFFVFGMVGRITKGKGYDLAIKAFTQAGIRNSKLLIIGSPNRENDKKYFNSLLDLVEKSSLKEQIIFVPHQSNISLVYKIIDIYLNPVVIDEGFGLSVAEAMASGVPVISSNYGGLSEFVKANETAELIDSRSVDAVSNLTNALIKMKENQTLSKNYARNAKEFIESRFNNSQSYVAISDVYQYLDSLD